MVILKFNKLIRNKWIWGAFAIVVGGAFSCDFLVDDLLRDDRGESGSSEIGKLAGKEVSASLFRDVTDDLRGFGPNRDWSQKTSEVNQQAWETCALLDFAEKNGIAATEKEVADMIRRDPSFKVQDGGFSFSLYQSRLRDMSLSPERFEAYLKRRLTMMKVAQSALVGTAVWASPMEIDQEVADMTDVFTVKVASFAETPAEAAAVKVGEAALKKWYDDNVRSLALPERIRLRMLKFDATAPAVLAKMNVTDDELRDHYDVTVDKYTSTDTNGVESVRKFDEVKAEVEREVRQMAAVQYFETNLNQRVYGSRPDKKSSRLDEIAKTDGLKVQVSAWFAADGSVNEGFMSDARAICPGATSFLETVADLNPESDDFRYGVVSSDKAVWLVEKAEVSPAHLPKFEEAKAAIMPRALRDARADAFKAKVEAIAKKGPAAALAAGSNVSTNLTFAICDLKEGEIPDQLAVLRAASKIKKGQVSEFVQTGAGKAILVVCTDRVVGDPAKIRMFRDQFRSDVETLQRREISESWQKWNLKRLGFEPGSGASVTPTEDEE